jgi:hypothetical protein
MALLKRQAGEWQKLRAALPCLYRRTRDRAIRAKHATIALLVLQPVTTILAVIEELAGVGRHRLGGLVSAMRTGERRFQSHQRFACAVSRRSHLASDF